MPTAFTRRSLALLASVLMICLLVSPTVATALKPGGGTIEEVAPVTVARSEGVGGSAHDAARPGTDAEEESPLVAAGHDTRERIGTVGEKLEDMIQSTIIMLPLVAIALVLLVFFWFLAKALSTASFLYRWIDNKFTRDLTQQVVRGVTFVIGLILALEILNATALVGATLGAAGVVGIALAFAFQDLAENYIAGVLLSTRQPFAPNDLVDINDQKGKIVRLTSRATILLTLDGNHLRIPNAVVYKGIIVNYTRNPKRRFAVSVGVGVNENLIDAQNLGISILSGMTAVLTDPAPNCIIEALGDSTVSLRFTAWVDQKHSDYTKSKSEATRLIKTAFDDAGIEMPEPMYRVLMMSGEPKEDTPGKPSAAKTIAMSPDRLREQDTSAARDIDDQIAAERRQQENDLLSAGGAKE